MQKTPMASRKHVSLFGEVNAGKSTLFNKILGQEAAIVSSKPGTTTDPVIKAMELTSFGPITLMDTAGLEDNSEIGEKRINKTLQILNRTDLALLVFNIERMNQKRYMDAIKLFEKKSISYIIVFTNCDSVSKETKQSHQDQFEDAIFIDYSDDESLKILKNRMIEKLQGQNYEDEKVIGDLLEENSLVVMVVPIDQAAPKGRLILPQVQLIRECLDHGMQCLVTRDKELKKTLLDVKKVDLVVTDSQAFQEVSKIVPDQIPLTSFSMLLARQKGDMNLFIKGVKKIDTLEDNDRILIAEACIHNTTHEDIGRVKIPNMIKKYTGKELKFEYYVGYDFPQDLDGYAMVIHCGGCMMNKRAVLNRLEICKEIHLPITNYGVLLAYLNGILPRCSEIFNTSRRRFDD